MHETSSLLQWILKVSYFTRIRTVSPYVRYHTSSDFFTVELRIFSEESWLNRHEHYPCNWWPTCYNYNVCYNIIIMTTQQYRRKREEEGGMKGRRKEGGREGREWGEYI